MSAQTASTNEALSLAPAVLGLDLGMTATRASLVRLGDKGNPNNLPIGISRASAHKSRQDYYASEFPATAYPLQLEEPPERCLGFATNANASPFPLKMFCYFKRFLTLVQEGGQGNKNSKDAVARIRKMVPQIDNLWKRVEREEPEYRDRVAAHLAAIFQHHMETVRHQSNERATKGQMRITKLAVTLPPNWDETIQKTYVDLLSLVWTDVAKDDIITIHESEAVGHWLLCLDQRWASSTAKQLLVTDFGGHTLNAHLFSIVRRDSGPSFAFFTVAESWTVHGGSELHTTLVKSKIESKIEKQDTVMSNQEKEFMIKECMKHYRDQYRDDVDGSRFYLEGRRRDGPGQPRQVFDFEPKETEPMYNRAFGKPLESLVAELNLQAKKTKDTVVILSGGSFFNQKILKDTIETIQNAGLTYLEWPADMEDPARRSSAVSSGAALAIANSLTVEEFIANAVFALDPCQPNTTELPVLLNSNQSRSVTQELTGRQGSKIFLVCAPLAPLGIEDTIQRSVTYELFSLGRVKKGKYRFSLAYHKDNHAKHRDWLILTMTMEKNGRPEPPNVTKIPIYYDPGGCVCFADWDMIKAMGYGGEEYGTSVFINKYRNKHGTRHRESWEERQRGASGLWESSLDQTPMEMRQTRAKARKAALQARYEKGLTSNKSAQAGSPKRRGNLPEHIPAVRPLPVASGPSRDDSPATLRAGGSQSVDRDRMRGHSITEPWEIADDGSPAFCRPSSSLKRPAQEQLSSQRYIRRQPFATMKP